MFQTKITDFFHKASKNNHTNHGNNTNIMNLIQKIIADTLPTWKQQLKLKGHLEEEINKFLEGLKQEAQVVLIEKYKEIYVKLFEEKQQTHNTMTMHL